MAQEKPSFAVKFQFILFGVLLLVFFIWAGGKCSRSQDSIETERTNEVAETQLRDSLARLDAIRIANQKEARKRANDAVKRDTLRGGQTQIIRERITPLYVTIEGLALREGPDLSKKILTRLSLFEEISFMNQVTDSLHTIKLGTITPTEPWIKVKSKKGQVGWVYGAGVDYYKRKFEGLD